MFTGMGVALVTPFNADSTIDFPALESLVDFLVKNGTDYLVALGSTGETPTLSKKDKQAVLSTVISANTGRVPVMVGMGSYSTLDLVEEVKSTSFKGVDCILSVSPYYNKPSQKGIYEHFKALAQVSPLPIVLYNIPGRTGTNISATTTLSLAHDFSNIIGIKEASGNLLQCCEILKDCPSGFSVISGDDGLVLPLIACGGHGVISVVGNAYPTEMSNLTHAAMEGDYELAQILNKKLLPLYSSLFAEGNPSGIKALMSELNLCKNVLRLPLVSVSNELKIQLADFSKKF